MKHITSLLLQIKKIGVGLFFLISFGNLLLAAPAGAFDLGASPDLGVQYPQTVGLSRVDVRISAARIIRIALGFVGIILVCITMYAGYMWMTAGGNEDKVSDAKKWIYSAVIGLILVLTSYAIVAFVTSSLTDATQFPT